MKNRRKAREAVLQALYQCDAQDCWLPSTAEIFFSHFCVPYLSTGDITDIDRQNAKNNLQFAKNLVRGILKDLDILDSAISNSSSRWHIDRMSRVDRNILRIGVYEIINHTKDVPLNVILNEAIEIAKRYGADESPTFINGILDNVARSTSDGLSAFSAGVVDDIVPTTAQHDAPVRKSTVQMPLSKVANS